LDLEHDANHEGSRLWVRIAIGQAGMPRRRIALSAPRGKGAWQDSTVVAAVSVIARPRSTTSAPSAAGFDATTDGASASHATPFDCPRHQRPGTLGMAQRLAAAAAGQIWKHRSLYEGYVIA
jgi:hypothetical protein